MQILFILLLMLILFLSSCYAMAGEGEPAKQKGMGIFFASLISLVVIFVWGQ